MRKQEPECICTHPRIDHGLVGAWCGFPDCNCSHYVEHDPLCSEGVQAGDQKMPCDCDGGGE
jgi:hypothetical protein